MHRSLLSYTAMLAGLVALSGCGTLIKGQTQNIKLETPGATEAECTLDNGVRYRLFTGESTEIMRSEKDLKVDCYASGNRHKTLVVPREFNDWSAANVANGVVPGVAYDHFSNGLYEYPAVLTVDFTTVKSTGFELPEYHNADAPNPYEQPIESYAPGRPRTVEDSNYVQREITRSGMGQQGSNPYLTLPQTEQDPASAIPNYDAMGNVRGPIPGGPAPGPQASGGYLSSPDAAWSPPKVSRQPAMPANLPPRGANAGELNRAMNPTVFNGNQ